MSLPTSGVSAAAAWRGLAVSSLRGCYVTGFCFCPPSPRRASPPVVFILGSGPLAIPRRHACWSREVQGKSLDASKADRRQCSFVSGLKEDAAKPLSLSEGRSLRLRRLAQELCSLSSEEAASFQRLLTRALSVPEKNPFCKRPPPSFPHPLALFLGGVNANARGVSPPFSLNLWPCVLQAAVAASPP